MCMLQRQRIRVDKCVSIKVQIYLMISDTTLKACNKRKQFYIANTNYYLWHCFDGNLKMICYILTVLSRMNKVVERDDTWIIGLFALFFVEGKEIKWFQGSFLIKHMVRCDTIINTININVTLICPAYAWSSCTKMHNSKIWLPNFC